MTTYELTDAERAALATAMEMQPTLLDAVVDRVALAVTKIKTDAINVAIGTDAQLAAAAKLHAPKRLSPEYRFAPWCEECSQGFTAGGDDPPSLRRVRWPCPTATALGLIDPLAPDPDPDPEPPDPDPVPDRRTRIKLAEAARGYRGVHLGGSAYVYECLTCWLTSPNEHSAILHQTYHAPTTAEPS